MPEIKNNPYPQSLEEAVYEVVHHSTVSAKAQAEALGIDLTRLYKCCYPAEGDSTTYHHTRFIISQTLITKNFALLDYLERSVGRVAIPILDPSAHQGQVRDLAVAAMNIAKEFGDLAESIRKGIEDGKLTLAEKRRIKKEAFDVIQKTLKVYHRLDEGAAE